MFYCLFYLPLSKHHIVTSSGNNVTASSLKPKETVNIMTYNVHGLPHTENPTCDNLIKIGRQLNALRKKENGPDIVAIQEGFHEKTIDMIKLSGYAYYSSGPGIDEASTKTNSGLWLLSKYPIIKATNTSYDSCATWDCFSNKGIQRAEIQIDGNKTLVVYNTHMNAYTEYDPWTDRKEIDRAKYKQIVQFKNFFNTTKNSNVATILLGDFNFVQRSKFYSLFMLPEMIDSISHIAGEMPKKLLDHQYVVQGRHMQLQPKKYTRLFKTKKYSDHSAIYVSYRIRETAS